MNELLTKETHFSFGKNWLDYAEKIDEARIVQAMQDLSRLYSGNSFAGKTFLDIGCGSGLHALAALQLGAAKVMCVDIDPDSVAATKATFARFAPDTPASIEVVSVFDLDPAISGQFDVVYSWGVLHHTGDMNRAIACATALVAPDGTFLIALYKKTPFCGMWRVIKKFYARSTPAAQSRMMRTYLGLKHTYLRLRNFDMWFRGKPIFDLREHVAKYGTNRGMDYYNDAHDWLGGYPYESISPEECFALFVRLGFEPTYSKIQRPSRLMGFFGSGCDEFGFRRSLADPSCGTAHSR